MVSDDGLVIFPPAAKSEGLGGLVSVHIEGHGELVPQLRLHTQQFQHPQVRGGLVGVLLRKPSLNGHAEHPVSLVGVGVAHLHMALVEGNIGGHPQEAAQAPILDEGIVPQLIELRLRQVFEAAVGPTTRLTEVGLLEPLVDGEGDGEQGCEENCGQGDGQNGDDIPCPGCLEGLPAQPPDTRSVGYLDHGHHPLVTMRPSSMRMMRSAIWAISSLWVIITMVWLNFWLVTFSRLITS